MLRQWDAWGNRLDAVDVSPLWREAERLTVKHGLVATAYEPAYGRHARIAQFLKVYLFHPSSDVYTCPLAMTDGAARCLIESGNQALMDRALPRLTARDPAQVLDQRAVDDRDDRRLGRRPLADAGGARGRPLAALRPQVVHLGGDVADGADAGAPRRQPGRRQGPRDVLSRSARCERPAERHPRGPAEGQARHAQGADRGVDARGHARGAGRAAGERHAGDRADAGA